MRVQSLACIKEVAAFHFTILADVNPPRGRCTGLLESTHDAMAAKDMNTLQDGGLKHAASALQDSS